MSNNPTLYLEIKKLNFTFFACKNDDQDNFKILFKLDTIIEGIENNKITDLEAVFDKVKKNIYLIEKKINFTFKELVIILDNYSPTFINFTGFKKLNGSQILRENITYILNTLKSRVDDHELKKTIIHIFNSKFCLDEKKIENLPIGLFGDFYSHELSFVLINKNDYRNLTNIFNKCNLRIKKTFIKNFIKGVSLSENYKNKDTFFQVKVNKQYSEVFYFENNSLKFEQNFNFGTDIILKDISKITAIKIDDLKKILDQLKLTQNILENDFIEEEFFKNNNFRKIKKSLIYEIALARISEICDIMITKNTNFQYYNKVSKDLLIEINHNQDFKAFKEIFKNFFENEQFKTIFVDSLTDESFLGTTNKLVHFGWKKEAIPILNSKKSKISRFFEAIFG